MAELFDSIIACVNQDPFRWCQTKGWDGETQLTHPRHLWAFRFWAGLEIVQSKLLSSHTVWSLSSWHQLMNHAIELHWCWCWHRFIDNSCWLTDPRFTWNSYLQEITQLQRQKTKRYSPGWQKTYPPSNRLNLSLHLFLFLTSICKGGYSPHSRVFANIPVLPRTISHMTGKRLSEKSWAK